MFAIKTFVLSFFEWPLKTSFTVHVPALVFIGGFCTQISSAGSNEYLGHQMLFCPFFFRNSQGQGVPRNCADPSGICCSHLKLDGDLG